MQFSNTPNFAQPKQSWWNKFTSQAHQLFFVSAIFFSIIIMLLSILSFSGAITLDFSLTHAFGLNYAVFTNAFLGFLITVIPKYNANPTIEEKEYKYAWMVFQVAILISLFVNAFIGKLVLASVMLYFSFIFYKIMKNSKAFEKIDSILITTIFVWGALLLIIESLFQTHLSQLVFFSYLLNMIVIVALRMVPSFYFNITRIQPWKKPKYLRQSSVVLLALIGVCLEFEFHLLLKILSFIALVFYTYVVVKLDFYKKVPAILSVLTYSFFWLVIGFLFLFIESLYAEATFKLSFHIFALGFITTLLIGFGSRVTLGHAVPARNINADKLTVSLFIFVQVLVIFRIFTSIGFVFNQEWFIALLYISTVFWVILFVVWSFRYGKILLRLD